MAIRVPIYRSQVQSSSLPGYRQNVRDTVAEAVGGLGEGIQRLTSGATQLAGTVKKVFDEQDAADQMEAYTELGSATQSLLNDPEAGFVGLKGKDAGAQRDSAISFFDAKVKEIESRRGNDRQKQAFLALAAKERNSFVAAVDGHVVKQAEKYAEDQFGAALSTAQSKALVAASQGRFDLTMEAIGDAEGIIDRRAEAMGWAPEVAETERRKARTGVHLQVLESMIDNGMVDEASEYLTTARDEMDGEALVKSNIEKVLGAAMTKRESSALGSWAWREADGDPVRAEGLLAERLADGKISEETYERGRRSLMKIARDDAAAKRMADAPRLGKVISDIVRNKKVTEESETDYARLSPPAKAQADAKLAAIRRAGSSDAKARRWQSNKNREAIENFKAREFVDEPGQGQLDIDIDEVYPDVTPDIADRLRAMQGKARKKAEGRLGVSKDAFRAQIKSDLVDHKIKGKATDPKSEAYAFAAEMMRQYEEWSDDPKNEGKTPPPEVVRKFRIKAMVAKFGGYNKAAAAILDQEGPPPTGESYRLVAPQPEPAWRREIEKQREAVKGAASGGGAEAPKAQSSAPKAAKPARRGEEAPKQITRTDPKTGETRAWDGKAWVPLKKKAKKARKKAPSVGQILGDGPGITAEDIKGAAGAAPSKQTQRTRE